MGGARNRCADHPVSSTAQHRAANLSRAQVGGYFDRPGGASRRAADSRTTTPPPSAPPAPPSATRTPRPGPTPPSSTGSPPPTDPRARARRGADTQHAPPLAAGVPDERAPAAGFPRRIPPNPRRITPRPWAACLAGASPEPSTHLGLLARNHGGPEGRGRLFTRRKVTGPRGAEARDRLSGRT